MLSFLSALVWGAIIATMIVPYWDLLYATFVLSNFSQAIGRLLITAFFTLLGLVIFALVTAAIGIFGCAHAIVSAFFWVGDWFRDLATCRRENKELQRRAKEYQDYLDSKGY